jgi:integrin beta 3
LKFILFVYQIDCSITEDGILHYHGKHSFTKFGHECLPWNDLQTIYPEIINEANFFNDPSIKAAKNYCRNPNMNVNGPWCFIENEDAITMEQCDVCQSLGISLLENKSKL